MSRDVKLAKPRPGTAPGRNVLDVHVLRLRRRLAPLGLAIRTVRSRGYMLEQATISEMIVQPAAQFPSDGSATALAR